MLIILLALSAISMIIFIYKLMETVSLKYIVAPLVGVLFGYLIYLFGMALPIYVLFIILAIPVIGMIVILARKDDSR